MARRQAEAELMQDIHFERIIKWTAGAARMAAVLFAAAVLSLPLAAQQQGPLSPRREKRLRRPWRKEILRRRYPPHRPRFRLNRSFSNLQRARKSSGRNAT